MEGIPRAKGSKNGKMSKHVQIEANMSLTRGQDADKRVPLTPSEQKSSLAYFYSKLMSAGGGNLPDSAKAALNVVAGPSIKK